MAEDVELERASRHRQWTLQPCSRRITRSSAPSGSTTRVEPENRWWCGASSGDGRRRWPPRRGLGEEHTRFLAREPSSYRQATVMRSGSCPRMCQRSGTRTPRQASSGRRSQRLLLERVEITLQGDTEKADVTCVWAGGHRTSHALVRSVRRTTQLSRHAELIERIRTLHSEGRRPPAITRTLVAEGWSSAHGKPYRESGVRSLMTRIGLVPARLARPDRHRRAQCGRVRAGGDCCPPEHDRGHDLLVGLQGPLAGAAGRGRRPEPLAHPVSRMSSSCYGSAAQAGACHQGSRLTHHSRPGSAHPRSKPAVERHLDQETGPGPGRVPP